MAALSDVELPGERAENGDADDDRRDRDHPVAAFERAVTEHGGQAGHDQDGDYRDGQGRQARGCAEPPVEGEDESFTRGVDEDDEEAHGNESGDARAEQPAAYPEGRAARYLVVRAGLGTDWRDGQEYERAHNRADRDRPERRPPAKPEGDRQCAEKHVPVSELRAEENGKQLKRLRLPLDVGDHVDSAGLD